MLVCKKCFVKSNRARTALSGSTLLAKDKDLSKFQYYRWKEMGHFANDYKEGSLNIINVLRSNPASAYHATVAPHVISSSTDEINKSNSRDDEQIAQTLLLLLFLP